MSIEAIVNEFSAVAANPKGQLKAYKDAGKKCIGVMPYYAPEELVYAAGMMPFGMWGSNDKTEQRSKEYCATFYCTIAQLDLEMLLEQTVNTGIDVYTHSEMLPAHYYPAFKKYEHFKGNYGNAWWKQKEEFEAFNGPILMTTNCIVPPKDSYKNRIYTTGAVRYPGCPHIDGVIGETKDFSLLIEQAKHCAPPTELEQGTIVGGFAHAQVLALADQIVDAVKSGAIKKFVVMAGCDGRAKSRSYYSDFAQALPKDTVILTAGCAKYKYNKLNLGDINGIPRVLDAGQCNDCLLYTSPSPRD